MTVSISITNHLYIPHVSYYIFLESKTPNKNLFVFFSLAKTEKKKKMKFPFK